jgi:ATP-dependent DNA ligase
MVIREGERVRLISRGGGDYTGRFPWIVEAARMNRQGWFIIDGEAVLLGDGGISDFDGLHSGKHDAEVQLYAFDILAMGSNDLRELPLSMRKRALAGLVATDGVPYSEGIFPAPFERGELGPDLFRKTCEFGLEGLVSKHAERAYSGGRCNHWIKVKNPKHPAYRRVQDQLWRPTSL